jgi:hypothetical protein
MMHGLLADSLEVRPIPLLWCVIALMLGSLAPTSVRAQQQRSAPSCRPDGPVATIPELPEASGIAVSLRVPGRLWAHNDSGQPILFALDARGSVTGRVRLSGVAVEDWEALAVGPCPTGSCIYVADIGDNDAQRKRITIYRLPEPSRAETSAAVKDVFHATYPDGAHDAEALLITPSGELLIVTKGDTGAVALYRFPRELRAGAAHQLERVGKPRGPGKPGDAERITDGAVSADGQWVVLRTGQSLTFHRTAELMAGNWNEVRRVDLKALGEAQGEGVALGADDTVFLTGEGGGKSQPGTFARFTCTANP